MSLSNSSFDLIQNLINELETYRNRNAFACDAFSFDSTRLVILKTESQQQQQQQASIEFSRPIYEPYYSNNTNANDYDYSGALCYIYFVLFWYAFCVVCMIKIQTKKHDLDYYDDSDDSESNTAHGLLKKIRDDTNKREALEELVRPGFRDRMWDIYTDTPNDYKIRKFENKKIQQIDRKLKQYYSQTGDMNNSKTVDLAQLERRTPRDSNLFLLKDVNKLETTSSQFNNSSTINSFMASSVAGARNSITLYSNDSHRERFDLLNMNFDPPTHQLNKSHKFSSNRFHVEKIKEF